MTFIASGSVSVKHGFEHSEAGTNRVVTKIYERDAWHVRRANRGKSQHRFYRVAQKTGNGTVTDSATAKTTPPITLGIGGDIRANLLLIVLVKALDSNIVGVTISSLPFMGIEASWEEKNRFTPRRFEGIINIGRSAAGPSQGP